MAAILFLVTTQKLTILAPMVSAAVRVKAVTLVTQASTASSRGTCLQQEFSAHLEPTGLCHSDGKCPDGASIMPWSCGRVLVWDATTFWDPKDPVPEKQRKGVVYSIPCGECPRTYIGQTGRTLDHRLAEHRQALKNGDVSASAIVEHMFAAGHQVDLSKATVIYTHPHAQTRCLLESWHIQHEQAPLNRGKGTLPGLYATLLD